MKTIRLHAAPFLLGLAILLGIWTVARGDTGSGSGSAVVAPHEQLHDPVDQPVETIRDIGDSRKVGWPAFAAAIVLVVCKLAGRAKGALKWLGEGWRPVVFTVATAVASGVYDAAVLGGTGVALLLALVVSLAAAIPNKGPATT